MEQRVYVTCRACALDDASSSRSETICWWVFLSFPEQAIVGCHAVVRSVVARIRSGEFESEMLRKGLLEVAESR